MRIVLLSHPIQLGGPVYPGDPPPRIEKRADAGQGDDYTAFVLTLSNHCSTHVDGPAHFNPQAPPLAELAIEQFLFRCPLLVEVPRRDDELIDTADLRQAVPQGAEPDMLMIRTGFEAVRAQDPERYARHSPGLTAAAARWVLQSLPSLRAIALDTISAGAPMHPDESTAAHRVLCGAEATSAGKFVLIYEDVRLSVLSTSPVRVWGLPLMVQGVDSAPVTMVAEV